MDTKSLYDAAVAAGTLYRNDDQATASDSVLPWTFLMLGNEEYLAEWYGDFTHELVASDKFERICRDMERAARDIEMIPTVSRPSTIATYACCMSGLLESIGVSYSYLTNADELALVGVKLEEMEWLGLAEFLEVGRIDLHPLQRH